MHDYIDAAIVLGSKNLDGRLTVASAPGLPFLLEEGMAVHFVPPVLDAPRNANVISAMMQGDASAIVRFDSIDSVDMAEMIIGCHCLVARDAVDQAVLEQIQEASLPAFEGWTFIDKASGYAGSIEGVDEMPGQVMLSLVVKGESAPTMVPLVDDFVVSQDEEAKVLILSLPGGIFDL